jgi:hypothetical protein
LFLRISEWSNIEGSTEDPEIAAINRFREGLGELPEAVAGVRAMISCFEACHFKYEKHYRNILKSIAELSPAIDVERIGSHHPRHGEEAVAMDATGRARVGQQYIAALTAWMEDLPVAAGGDDDLTCRVALRLGQKNDRKVSLVTMLLDRLFYRSLEEYMRGNKLDELEYQVLRTDICSYDFPQNLDRVIQAIGQQKPVEDFQGCGTCKPEIEEFIRRELEKLRLWLMEKRIAAGLKLGEKTPEKKWLVACLAKTLKEQAHLECSIPGMQ